MAEPHVMTGVVVGAAISPVALLIGAQVDALVVGLMAAVFATIWLETVDSKPKAAAAVALSAMLAGYGSPVAASYVASAVPSVADVGDGLRLLCAAVIGASVTWVLPLVMRYAKTKSGEGV